MYNYLLRTVKVFLVTAIGIVFLRALFFPNVLDIFVLLLLFLVLLAMFLGT
ncbi:MAG TPA: hypothetical protein VFV52_08030 [Bacilli bacterium]|nr:hypothetical protein [Bacilli bacterium]